MATQYSYNKAHTKQLLAERRHVCGRNFARTITDADKFDSDNNDNVMVIVTSMALKDPEDPSSKVPGSELRDFITLPIDNPEVDGHSILEYEHYEMVARNSLDYLSAVFPEEVPAPPRRIEADANGKPIGAYYYQGEEIDADDYKLWQAEAMDIAGPKSAEVANDPSILIGCGYFCHVRGKNDANGIFRINQTAYRAELPEWWELETEEFVEKVEAGNKPAAAKAKATGRRKKKTTKKKATRRGKRK